MDDRPPLSPRQAEIVRLAGEGLTDREIARRLGLTEGTLRSHWGRIRDRCGASTRGAIVSRACQDARRSLEVEVEVLHHALRASRTLVWTVRADGVVDYCNDWFREFGGRPLESFLGKGCELLMPDGVSEGGEGRWGEVQARAQASGLPTEVSLRDGAGRLVPHLVRMAPHEAQDGAGGRWLGTAEPAPPERGEAVEAGRATPIPRCALTVLARRARETIH